MYDAMWRVHQLELHMIDVHTILVLDITPPFCLLDLATRMRGL